MSLPPPSWISFLGSDVLINTLIFAFVVSQSAIGFLLGPKVGNELGLVQVGSLPFPQMFRDIVGGWTVEEQGRFRRHFVLDFWIHPTLYSLMFVALVTRETKLAGKSPMPYFVFVSFILLAGTCDILENSIHHELIDHPNQAPDAEIQKAGFFSLLKWAIVIPTFVWCGLTWRNRVSQTNESKDKSS